MELDVSLDSRYILENPIDCAIQELDMILGTECTEMLGDPYFGVSMEQFLWQTTPSPSQVQSYIQDKITQYTLFCRQMKTKIDVETVEGTIRDIYLIKITIEDNIGQSKSVEWTYK